MVMNKFVNLLLCILFVACKSTNNNAPEIVDMQSVNSVSEKLNINTIPPVLLLPQKIVDTKYKLFVLNPMSDMFFDVFDKSDNMNHVGRVLTKGKGPNEVLHVDGSTISFNDGSIKFSDAMSYLSMDIKTGNIKRSRIRGKYTPVNGLFKLNDTTFTCNNENISKENDFEFMNIFPHNDSLWGDFPNLINIEPSQNDMKMNIYSKATSVKPDKSAFVSCYNYFPLIRIYKNFSLYKEKMLPVDKEQSFFEEGEYQNSKENIVYFSQIFSTDNFIYTLLYNKSIKELEDTEGDDIPYIIIWDWECNPIKKINLDYQITSFTVSANDSVLYGVSQFAEDKIFSLILR